MPVDPAAPFPVGDDANARRTAERLAGLERRMGALEAGNPIVQSGSGAPTTDPATLRTGTPYIDTLNARLYYVVSGAWRWVALT